MKVNINFRMVINFVLHIITSFIFLYFHYNLISFKILVISLTLTIASSIFILYKNKNGFLMIYLFYLYLTNYGIYLTNCFIENPFLEYHGDLTWYYKNFKSLLEIVSFGLLLFSLLSIIMIIFNIKFQKKHYKKLNINNSGDATYFYTGIFFIILFTFQFLYYILTGKLSINTYGDYVDSIQKLPMYTYGVFIFSVGIAFAFSNVKKTNLKYLIMLITPQCVLFLATGNRGEVFYPILTALGVLIIRGIKLKWGTVILFIFTLFFLIPLIKINRQVQSFSFNEININWFSSLVEIGYTLRPFGYVYDWIRNGETLSLGYSYLAPIQNIFSKFIPGLSPVDYKIEGFGFRYRLEGMGFNVMAEAYYNGAIVGMIIIIMILVFVLTKFSHFGRFTTLSIGAAVTSVLINNIRNAFSFVPGYILIILLISIILYITKNFIEKE